MARSGVHRLPASPQPQRPSRRRDAREDPRYHRRARRRWRDQAGLPGVRTRTGAPRSDRGHGPGDGRHERRPRHPRAPAAKDRTEPQVQRLSERVNDIVEEWEQGDRSDPEAVEALTEVEEEVLTVEAQAGDQAKAQAEFAIYTHLTEETPAAVDSEDEAQAIAADIVDEFEERIDRGYPGWEANETTVQTLEVVLLDALLKDHDRPALAKDDAFLTPSGAISSRTMSKTTQSRETTLAGHPVEYEVRRSEDATEPRIDIDIRGVTVVLPAESEESPKHFSARI